MPTYKTHIFCGMTGAATPRKLDPRVIESQESCNRFFNERLDKAVDAGATTAILHMPQGYIDGHMYAAACSSQLHEHIRHHLTRCSIEIGFDLYTGILALAGNPESLEVGDTPNRDNLPDWSQPQWERFAQREWGGLPFRPQTLHLDMAGDENIVSDAQWAALKGVAEAVGSFLSVEPHPPTGGRGTQIQTLSHTRRFGAGIGAQETADAASLIVIEKGDNPTINELAGLVEQGHTLVPSWSMTETEIRLCYSINGGA